MKGNDFMNEQACTTILVGKKATIDGSTMIARNDDTFLPLTPQRFVMQQAYHDQEKSWASTQNGFKAPLPRNGYRTTMTPNVDVKNLGYFGESSINEKNVAMSATESVYGNPLALAHDPWVKDGLAEDSLQSLVAPYIDSAREGVLYLGELIKKYGSPEGNGVLFADKDDVWYMEIVTGHHWAATRIPDDAYAIAANQVAQDYIDFNDPDNYMWSDGLQEFVEKYHLNPDPKTFNFRRIFGTDNEKDRHYNTPRVWYGQHIFNPEIKQEPWSSDLPFICRSKRLLKVEDLTYVLSSHYNETKYDPLGHGSEEDKLRFRPISLNRTQNSHVLQLRNDVPEKLSALMWICLGVPTFTPYIPFYTNATDTDNSFSQTPLKYDITSAYWMYRTLSMLVESHYSHFVQNNRDYLIKTREMTQRALEESDNGAKELDDEQTTAYLTAQNKKLVQKLKELTMQEIANCVTGGLELSKLTFDMDKNL